MSFRRTAYRSRSICPSFFRTNLHQSLRGSDPEMEQSATAAHHRGEAGCRDHRRDGGETDRPRTLPRPHPSRGHRRLPDQAARAGGVPPHHEPAGRPRSPAKVRRTVRAVPMRAEGADEDDLSSSDTARRRGKATSTTCSPTSERSRPASSAAALAKRGVVPDLIVSGELRRHRQTADERGGGGRLVRAAPGHRRSLGRVRLHRHHPRLRRRVSPVMPTSRRSPATGRPATRSSPRCSRGSLRGWIDGGREYIERFDQFCGRVGAACDDVVAQLEDDQTAVVFTSGGPIGAVANRALGGRPDQWLKLHRVGQRRGLPAARPSR